MTHATHFPPLDAVHPRLGLTFRNMLYICAAHPGLVQQWERLSGYRLPESPEQLELDAEGRVASIDDFCAFVHDLVWSVL